MRLAALVLAILFGAAPAHAQQDVSVQARVNRTHIPLNATVQLDIVFEGVQRVAAPDLELQDFDVRYIGPSTSIQIINGQMSSSVVHRYMLQPLREGQARIPSLSLSVQGRQLATQPITVTVGPAAAATAPGGSLQIPSARGGMLGIEDALNLTISLDRTQAFVGEPVKAKVQMLVNGVGVSSVSLPQLQLEGALHTAFKEPEKSQVNIGGQPHILLEFETLLIPLNPGELAIGPAEMEAEVVIPQQRRRMSLGDPFFDDLFDSFLRGDIFGERRSVSLRAEPLALTVLPLPSEDRPASFSGAVGQFQLQVQAEPRSVEAGEPVTLTLSINGEGNFQAVTAPKIEPGSGYRLYDAKIVSAPESGEIRGSKRFEAVMIPMNASVKELPPVEFSFFDPVQRRYVVQRIEGLPLTVRPSASPQPAPPTAGAPAPRVETTREGKRQIVGIKTDWTPAAERPVFNSSWWLAVVLPVLAWLASGVLRRRRERLLADPRAARAAGARRRALADLRKLRGEDCAALARILQGYAADRWGAAEGMTSPEFCALLESKGAPSDLVEGLRAFLEACDRARFAPGGGEVPGMAKQAEELIKRMERV